MELNRRYRHALSSDLDLQPRNTRASNSSQKRWSTNKTTRKHWSARNPELQPAAPHLLPPKTSPARCSCRVRTQGYKPHLLQAITKRLYGTITVRRQELLQSNQFPQINEKASEETATNSTTSILSACKTPPAKPGPIRSLLPLLRVPVISLKIVWANLTMPCLHLLEQPLMAQTKEGLFLTGSRNIKAEFFAKFSSRSAQNSALTRWASASLLSFAFPEAPERSRAPAARFRCSAALRSQPRCPAGSCRARGGEEEEQEEPSARTAGPLQTGAAAWRLWACFPSWPQLGCQCYSHQAQGNQ